MPLLFEYWNWETIKNKNTLQQMLQDIWKQKIFVDSDFDFSEEQTDRRYQPFLQFDGNSSRANNYVGFIQNDNEVIEIYPKVFRHHFPNPTPNEKALMLQHIFYWFNYCRKWKFPFNKVSLDIIEIEEFPELIINMIANQFLETISKQPLTMYQEFEEALTVPRGSVNFQRYISKRLSHGNFHQLECDFEPFLFDNKVNRIIKYCSRLLMNQTRFPENLRMLQEVVFILDEVEDSYCTVHDIEKISLNSFFDDYSSILDSCKLILSQKLYSSNTYDLSQWCLLFPMEYIFEDFVAGFLEENFSSKWKVEYQKSKFLSNTPEVFKMQHDIYLTSKLSNKNVIIDTKYKLRVGNFKQEGKKGVEQSDLYQMVSYAFKRGCTDIFLLYPNLTENIQESDTFEIISEFAGKDRINITAMEIPFWTKNAFSFQQLEKNLNKTLAGHLNKFH